MDDQYIIFFLKGVLMRYFMFLMFFLGSILFADPSIDAQLNINLANEVSNSDLNKSIAMCTEWIERDNTNNIDKSHYYAIRSGFHLLNSDIDGYQVDIKLLKCLCLEHEECFWEIINYYDDMDFSNIQYVYN